jgi:hypothetical protein
LFLGPGADGTGNQKQKRRAEQPEMPGHFL